MRFLSHEFSKLLPSNKEFSNKIDMILKANKIEINSDIKKVFILS